MREALTFIPKFGVSFLNCFKVPPVAFSHSVMKIFISQLFYHLRTWGVGRDLPNVISLEQCSV